MKRLTTAALSAVLFAGPLAGAAFADPPHRHDNGRYDGNRYDNRGRDYDRRDTNRWDNNRYNGYYLNGRWNYGPPPAWAQARRDFRPGYQAWRRGERLPSYYRSHYREVDWRRERLRQPPRGYHYVRDDRGEVLLVAVATGVILSVLLGN
ncbi:MAG: RcnB family protein [Hyphomonadaceae bacterium]